MGWFTAIYHGEKIIMDISQLLIIIVCEVLWQLSSQEHITRNDIK